MSQRSALMPAATATAEVSEPPRPKVEMRLPARNALKARHHRDFAPRHAGDHFRGGHAFDAGGAMHGGGLDRHLPAHPGPCLDAHGVQGDGQKARRHLFARRHHHVIFALVRDRLDQDIAARIRAGGLVGPGHQLVGFARHGRNHHGHLVAAFDFALDQGGDMANAGQIGHRRAPEFHRDFRHLRPKPDLPCPLRRPT